MAKIRYQFGIINTPLDMKTKFKVILNSCNDLHQYHEFNNLSNTGWHIHGLLFRNLVHHHAWVMQGHVFCTSPCLFMLLCTNILSYYFPRYSYGCNSHSWYFINPIPLLFSMFTFHQLFSIPKQQEKNVLILHASQNNRLLSVMSNATSLL